MERERERDNISTHNHQVNRVMNQLRYRTAAHAAPRKIGTRLAAPPLLPRGLALLGRYCGNDASGGGTVAWREEQQLVLRMEEKELRDWKARPCAESLVIFDSNFFPTFEKSTISGETGSTA